MSFDMDRKAVGLSAITGMRSMSGPALLARDLSRRQPAALDGTPFGRLRSPLAALLLGVMALGEMGADKLPEIPARIAPQPLIGRMALGGLVGAAYSAERGESQVRGALRGALVAGVATFASYFFRMGLASSLPLPQQFVGGLEDAFVLAAGLDLITRE